MVDPRVCVTKGSNSHGNPNHSPQPTGTGQGEDIKLCTWKVHTLAMKLTCES